MHGSHTMKHTLLNLLVLAGLWVGVLPLRAGVDVDVDPAVEFEQFSSFSWSEGTAAKDPEIEKKIRVAVERELISKGYQRVREAADLTLVVHSALDVERRIDISGQPYWYRYREWGRLDLAEVEVYELDIGTICVDILDAETGHLIWRGLAKEVDARKREDLDMKINRAVEKMFRKFPHRL